jgi:hypothetical protein
VQIGRIGPVLVRDVARSAAQIAQFVQPDAQFERTNCEGAGHAP